MSLSPKDEHDLLQALSIIRRVLAANGSIQHDPVKIVERCSKEMTPYEETKSVPDEPQYDDIEPSHENSDSDSQADGIKEIQ